MILYHLPTSKEVLKCGSGSVTQSFPFRFDDREVNVCCNVPLGKEMVHLETKEILREYNIPDLSEIGCMVSSPSMLWIMDKWTRKIYTIKDGEEPKEMEIGKNFHKPLRAVSIATYTDHAIILMEDIKTGETYLFGHGSGAYYRFETEDLSQPIFIPHEELEPSSRITHISCCFSWSICVINNRDIHISGQNWIPTIKTEILKWKDCVYRCPKDVISIYSGNFFFIAILNDYSIVSGGSNNYGENTQYRIVKAIQVNSHIDYPVVSASLGAYCSILKSKRGSFYKFGQAKSKNEEGLLEEQLCIVDDHAIKIPHDEAFIERDNEVIQYRDNSILLVRGPGAPFIVNYSSIPIPNCQIKVLPSGIVFYSKGAHNIQRALHSKITNPKSYFISDIDINFDS